MKRNSASISSSSTCPLPLPAGRDCKWRVMIFEEMPDLNFQRRIRFELSPYLIFHSIQEVARRCSTENNRPHHRAWNGPAKKFIVFSFMNCCTKNCHLRTPPKAPVMPPRPSEAASERDRAVSSSPSLTYYKM